jgi:YD repeat-containing protein
MKSYILTIAFSILVLKTFAQFPRPQISTQSPNAAGISLHEEIPVSLYTGTPQINIPLYTLEEGKISVPISLSYHASGVRPNQHPGWVGMGWSLNAGGAITRKVRDIPDDVVSGNTPIGLFSTNSLLRPNNPNPNYWETSAYVASLGGATAATRDTEPDEFSFNFLGFSGSFYIDGESGTLKVRSEYQFKVEVLNSNYICPITRFASCPPCGSPTPQTLDCISSFHPTYAREFKLTDLNGTVYYFGGDESSIEFSINFFQQYDTPWIPNAWYLKKIVTPEGRSVTFNYDDGAPTDGFPFFANLSYAYYIEDFKINGGTTIRGLLDLVFGPNLNPSCESWSNLNYSFIYGGDLIRPVYLKDITVSTVDPLNSHKIVFEKDLSSELRFPNSLFNDFYTYRRNVTSQNQPASDMLPYLTNFNETNTTIYTHTNRLKWYKLNSFKVYNQRNELINQYNFSYNNVAIERLFLNSVSKKENGASSLQTYSFSYFDKNILPGYFNEYDKTDHWGFINEGNGSDIKGLIASRSAGPLEISRRPTQNAAVAKRGTLVSITYPTGGTTTFDYEPNTYSKIVSDERSTFATGTTTGTAGGIRVKSITSCESSGASNCLTKQYFYVSGYSAVSNPSTLTSSGILAGSHKYEWNYTYTVPGYTVTSEVFSASSLLPGSENSYGSHIGYSEVVEKQSGNGYTIYKFTNFGTENGQHMDEKVPDASRYNLAPVRTIYEPFIDKSYERGKLTSQLTYTDLGALVSSNAIEYTIVNPSVIRAIKANSLFVCGTTNNVSSGLAYKIHKSLYLPSKETSVQYGTDGNSTYGSITTEVNYEYNNLGFERIKKVKQSDGSELITRKVYVGDLSINDLQIQNNGHNYCTTSPRPAEYTSCYNSCIQGGGSATGCELNCTIQCKNAYANARYTKPNTVDLRQMIQSYIMAPVVEQQTWKLVPGGSQTLLSGGINFFKKYATGYQVKQSNALPQLPDISDVTEPNRNYTNFPFSNIDSDYNFNYYGKYSAFPPVVKFDDINGYDSKGNVVEFKGRDGVITTYVWGYQHMYPVATIVGATYQDVITALGYAPNENTAFQAKVRKEDVLPVLQILRTNLNISKPMAQVTTRTYKSGVGINTETSPSGLITTYEYDKFNRLETVFDNEGKVLKSYKYNYKN